MINTPKGFPDEWTHEEYNSLNYLLSAILWRQTPINIGPGLHTIPPMSRLELMDELIERLMRLSKAWEQEGDKEIPAVKMERRIR